MNEHSPIPDGLTNAEWIRYVSERSYLHGFTTAHMQMTLRITERAALREVRRVIGDISPWSAGYADGLLSALGV